MATSKTLTPTNVTIQIPEFTDQPDQRVNSNCIDKEADAINALNGKITLLNVGTATTDNNGILHLQNLYDVTQYTAICVRSRELSNYYFSGVMNAKSTTFGESVVAFNYTGAVQKEKTINGVEVLLYKYA